MSDSFGNMVLGEDKTLCSHRATRQLGGAIQPPRYSGASAGKCIAQSSVYLGRTAFKDLSGLDYIFKF